jgi:hypothetical protein
MARERSSQLELFRQKAALLLETYAKKMKIFIEEESLAGSGAAEIRKMREDPESGWSKEREAVNKDLKREAAGIVNLVHITAVMDGLK